MPPARANRLRFPAACLVLFLAIIGISAAGAPGQAPKRIKFAKGHSSATIAGATGQYGATYLVRARSGQKLVLTLNPRARVGIKVEGIGRYGRMVLLRERRGGTYEVGLEESGDYTIFVGSIDNRSVQFSLRVRITRMTDI